MGVVTWICIAPKVSRRSGSTLDTRYVNVDKHKYAIVPLAVIVCVEFKTQIKVIQFVASSKSNSRNCCGFMYVMDSKRGHLSSRGMQWHLSSQGQRLANIFLRSAGLIVAKTCPAIHLPGSPASMQSGLRMRCKHCRYALACNDAGTRTCSLDRLQLIHVLRNCIWVSQLAVLPVHFPATARAHSCVPRGWSSPRFCFFNQALPLWYLHALQ